MKKMIAAALLLMVCAGPAYAKPHQDHPKNYHLEHHQKPHMDTHRDQRRSHHK
jgi:hypothetical protein